MIKKILIGIVAIIAVFIVVVALRPSQFHIERTATFSAPPAVVFESVNDLHKYQEWSPWAKLDPAAKNSFEGPGAGVGAVFKWSGNDKVGEGSMTIIESHPTDLVKIRLDFVKPFSGTNITEFTIKPQGEGSVMVWSMEGTNSFLFKAVGLFMDCDKMVGDQFEQGLTNLKSIVEKK